ncbi:hypothetical protein ZPAH1_orf00407 [Aeromonas phage ZPAH1]|nr:hypothetical protein ZPAH1_orf00407 [Aeromonas phage ZPAH1]
MKTILDYIKSNPDAFVGACGERARTTPSELNRTNHQKLAIFIENGCWDKVEDLIHDSSYWKPLEGVILVADGHGLDRDDWLDAYDAYQAGKIS